MSELNDQKATKRRKQKKKMSKILTRAWEFSNSEPFQESNKESVLGNVFDLAAIGKNLDEGVYKLGRSGWESFARDIGGVYNRHIKRKTKYATKAKEQREKICQSLTKIDNSLMEQATSHCPHDEKRNSETVGRHSSKRSASSSSEMTIVEREEKAMHELECYIEKVGGDKHQVSSFNSKATKKGDGRYDINFFSANRRFRSMVEIARFLNLVKEKQPPKKKTPSKKRPSNSRDAENEKKKLRKEIDKLMKSHQKATKALDDFRNEQTESLYPVDDSLLMEENSANGIKSLPLMYNTCSAARFPDLERFPGVPNHCLPDLIMVWDFLCTFSRPLSLNPIGLEDFVTVLTYNPPDIELDGIDSALHQPPIYLAEAHLGLLKLLLQDPSSDDWWWSILETDELEKADGKGDLTIAVIDEKLPVIKIDFAGLLAQEEDPLITASWLQALEVVRTEKANQGRKIKQAVKTANAVVANRYVKAYLKKSLTDWKPDAAMFTKRAVIWLIDRVREARPDLFGRSVSTKAMMKQRAIVVDQIAIQMEKMDDSGDVVAVEDLDSDEDESDDESDDENHVSNGINEISGSNTEAKIDESNQPVDSTIPPKPLPTLVDLLLPPGKPYVGSDIISSFTWPHITGASVCRLIHRYKRLRNEVDDSIRDAKGLAPISVGERRQREAESISRVFSESIATGSTAVKLEDAAKALSSGMQYLKLGALERLCILKVLVDAAYDSLRVHEVVDSNYKQRFSAVKALDAEERRAKREAREEIATADQVAREKLAIESREKFLEEKRNELRKLNKRTNEYSDTVIDEFTNEDIIDFDDDYKAEYAALPTPQSFSKSEVNKMVKIMQERAAFDASSVVIISMNQIKDRDTEEINDLEAKLQNYDHLDIYQLGREGSRQVERLKREIDQIKSSEIDMEQVRESALDMLKEALEDGTVKSLKAAIRTARQAKLTGNCVSTGGVWAVDILRDAALELKSAERRKRVIEAKKDLVAKMNKCFIRTKPIGRDRFRNRFWHFDHDINARVWVEAQYHFDERCESTQKNPSFVNLMKRMQDETHGSPEKEDDLLESSVSKDSKESFLQFSRKEFHHSGNSSCLVSRYFGGHVTEKALKGLAKNLDDRGNREHQLKVVLKETLEESGLSASKNEDGTCQTDGVQELDEEMLQNNSNGETVNNSNQFFTNGDEDSLGNAIKSFPLGENESRLMKGILSAIGLRVRVRQVEDSSSMVEYNLGVVSGWKSQEETISFEGEDANEHSEDLSKSITYPIWKVIIDKDGSEVYLKGEKLIDSICRYKRWISNEDMYLEKDSKIFSYRNSLGRHCGKAADAGISALPIYLARLMLKREQELYMSLKNLTFDNNWGGKSSARNIWIASLKEESCDFGIVKTALFTLEDAFFDLTGGFPESMLPSTRSAKDILGDVNERFDIELESIEKNSTLWNSRQSREIFLNIMENCKTTGFLALGLDLICRNCWVYINANKPIGRRAVSSVETQSVPTTRSTRRMNAWQQANQDWY